MPDVVPFNCYYFRDGNDKEKLKDLVAPPYDVISDEEKEAFKKKNPNNICHVILPTSYSDAGVRLREMIKTGVLTSCKDECLYIYGIEFKRPDTEEQLIRYGFVGLLKLVEIFPANDGVIPHEMVFKKFTDDRYNWITNTNANDSPLFMIYNGKGTIEKIFKKHISKKPILHTIDRDNFTHKIWDITDSKEISAIQEIIKNNSIIIADGHHRYITSLRYSKQGGCKYVMALFIDFNDPGLLIFTNHREILKFSATSLKDFKEKVGKFFEIQDIKNLEELKKLLYNNRTKHIFGCYYQKTYMFIKLKDNLKPEELIWGKHSNDWKQLNLPILQYVLLHDCLGVEEDDVTYVKDISKGVEKVDKGQIKALFIVNYTTLEEVHKITHLGEIMPHKSTYFYPKPLSGLIMHVHPDKIEPHGIGKK